MKAAATRDRVLEEGLQALSKGGLSSVTIGGLATAAGLSKSGLFAHFRSREALEIALLDEAARLAREHVVAPAMPLSEGLPRLVALVGLWFGWSARAGLCGGCPIVAALFELDDMPGELRNRVAALDGEWRSLLRRQVEVAVEKSELGGSTDPDQVVWELFGIYLAHHSTMRFHRDPEADKRAQNAVIALLRRSGADPTALERT